MKGKLIGLAVVLALLFGSDAMAGKKFWTLTIQEDSAGSGGVAGVWVCGDSLAVSADFDTSVVYDAQKWDKIGAQVKFAPQTVVGSADSGAVTMVVQMSNDQIYWTPIDSVVAVDSLAMFGNITLQSYRYVRAVVHHGTKIDSAGAVGTIIWNVEGED